MLNENGAKLQENLTSRQKEVLILKYFLINQVRVSLWRKRCLCSANVAWSPIPWSSMAIFLLQLKPFTDRKTAKHETSTNVGCFCNCPL